MWKVRQPFVQLPDDFVQPLHKFCPVGIRLDSAEFLTYPFAHRGGIQEGIPLRPDDEQVGLEDLDVLESSDLPHYVRMTSQAASPADRW